MLKRLSICYVLFILCTTCVSAQEDRWTGSATNLSKGNLRVNSSGRYLEYTDGTPFLYLGDTAWELISRLNDKETERYLENRREKGFTVIQTVILDELDGINTSSNGVPQLIDGNIDQPSPEYFARVDKVISLAAAKGLYIALLPTWGDKVDKQWGKGPEIFTPENAYRYGKWLGERYMNMPNLIWVIGGDRSGGGKNLSIWNALATGIKSIDQNHLMTYHPQGEHSSSYWFHDAPWLDFNMCQSGHAQQDFAIYQRILLPDLNRKPHKPCMDGEPRYENIPINFKKENGRFGEDDVRHTLYQSMFSGACGYTYGCNDIWQMFDTGRESKCDADTPWHQAMDKQGAWDLIHFRRLWEKFDFTQGKNLQTIFGDVPLENKNYPVAFGNKDYLLVYFPQGGERTIYLPSMKASKRSLKWMNPRNGRITFHQNTTADTIPVSSPTKGKGNDWVLIIE